MTTTIATYDFSADVARFSAEAARTVRDLSHVDAARIAFCVTRSRAHRQRRGKVQGIYAACHPLRFERGATTARLKGRRWEWPSITVGGVEMLYAVTFYLPRFFDLPPRERLHTVIHELYHVSPAFNGDLRRLGAGSHAYHGPSREFFERLIAPCVEEAQAAIDPEEYPFLTYSHAELRRLFDRLVGLRLRGLRPRLARE